MRAASYEKIQIGLNIFCLHSVYASSMDWTHRRCL